MNGSQIVEISVEIIFPLQASHAADFHSGVKLTGASQYNYLVFIALW